jgi:pimeloyl-ACP methyl ester carboxylesterase
MKLLNYIEKGTGYPLIFLHGLFGSSSVWSRIAERFKNDYRCILPDLDGHGSSPSPEEISYPGMAGSLIELLKELNIGKCICIGHSMGGKTAMAAALDFPGYFDGIGVVDIAPKNYQSVHKTIIEAMRKVHPEDLDTRKEGDERLSSAVSDRVIRSFLLKNLVRREEGGYRWRIDLDMLDRSADNLASWPGRCRGKQFQGPVLFLAGERSDYFTEQDKETAGEYFPRAQVAVMKDAGHWIHFDQYENFTKTLTAFITRILNEDS